MCLQSTRLSARRPLSCSRWQGGRHFREHYGARHSTGRGAGPGQKLAAKPVQPLSAADAAAANGGHACPHRCLGTVRPHSEEGRSLFTRRREGHLSIAAWWRAAAHSPTVADGDAILLCSSTVRLLGGSRFAPTRKPGRVSRMFGPAKQAQYELPEKRHRMQGCAHWRLAPMREPCCVRPLVYRAVAPFVGSSMWNSSALNRSATQPAA